MLNDISNNLNIYDCSRSKQNQHVLKTLKIVNRNCSENMKKINNENMKPRRTVQSATRNNAKGNNSSSNIRTKIKYNNKNSNNSDINNNKMLDEPHYRFNKICQSGVDPIFPFYHINMNTDSIMFKDDEPKLDFTNDVKIQRNNVKKYSKPINIKYLDGNEIDNSSSYLKRAKSNIFYNVDSNENEDPITGCFIHMKEENKLRFGDFMLTVSENGCVESVFSPVIATIQNNFTKRLQEVDNDADDNITEDDEELLYLSEENEISRLENSDLDMSDDEEENELDIQSYDDHNVSIELMNSSFIGEKIPPSSVFNLKSETESNINKNYTLSPSKKDSLINTSPQRQELLFRTLKNKSSPIKALSSQRSGINLPQISKPRHTNYSKLDNSMTISAKAIMKMVDDSLVSSDTEIYNHSHSLLTMKNKLNCSIKDDVNISVNAADLMDALKDDVDSPLTRKLKDLKL